MKIVTSGSSDVIWTNVELSQLTQEGCLPEIGCQVTSILSDLDEPIHDKILPNNDSGAPTVELMVLRNNEYKMSHIEHREVTTKKSYIALESSSPKNDGSITRGKSKAVKTRKMEIQDNYEDMLYFVCNLCPFLCTKDSKITEHIENAHKNKAVTKLLNLKCPACQNVFYHKVSLRSHLIHDHGVGNSELGRIIQAVVYFTKKNQNSKNNSAKAENQIETNNKSNINCKNEMELKYVEKLTNSEKLNTEEGSQNDESNADNDLQNNDSEQLVDDFSTSETEYNKNQSIKLPGLQATNLTTLSNEPKQDNGDKVFKGILKRQSNLAKYFEQRKLHKCILPLCKVRLQDLDKLDYHICTHIDNGFQCPECNETFTLWNTLKGHLWRLHQIDMELFSCDKCDYKTVSLGKLNSVHKLIHGDVKAFVCSVCEKKFKNAKQLRNHKEIHKEKSMKPIHPCEVCNKTFFDKRQLRIHMDSVHKKIKPFLCNYCGYKGSSKGALKMHIRQHTGEKPFTCDSCEYSTADHNSLRRHKLRHTGVKPYKCVQCDYACIQSSTYKVHLKTKHPGTEKDFVFVCFECQFKTVNKNIYLNHLSSVHKEKVFQ